MSILCTSTSLVLGVDGGGTATRVVVAGLDGRVVGRGRAGPGNPVARPASETARALAAAASEALAGHDPADVVGAVIGLAGRSRLDDPAVAAVYAAAGRSVGLPCPLRAVGDAVVAFAAGTPAPSGTVLIAGTGAIAVEIVDRTAGRTADGLGWLLGDEGGGFWLGLAAARLTARALATGAGGGPLVDAVTTAVHHPPPDHRGRPAPPPDPTTTAVHGPPPDHRGPSVPPPGPTTTAVHHPPPDHRGRSVAPLDTGTAAVLHPPPDHRGRPAPPLDAFLTAFYGLPAERVAALAPVVLDAVRAGDPEAVRLVDRAADHLAATFAALEPGPGPVVLAGGLLTGPDEVRTAVRTRLARPTRTAGDAAGAAAWLALRDLVPDADALHRRLTTIADEP